MIVAAVADEEAASVGTISVLERLTADAGVVPEFTDLEVCVAHKGFVWLEVETRGKAAHGSHGSRPEEGVDAVAKMGKVLVELEDLDVALRSSPSHGLLGSGSAHASTITGGQELSSYPERCLLKMERRTVPARARKASSARFKESWTASRTRTPISARRSEPRSCAIPTRWRESNPSWACCARRPRQLRDGSPGTSVVRVGWTPRCCRRPGYPRWCTVRAGLERTRRSSG